MANVILHKKKKNDSTGSLSILYFQDGKKKQKSLKFRMDEVSFRKYFIRPLNQFVPNPVFDYKSINQIINEHLIVDAFNEIIIPTEQTLLKYIDRKIALIGNPNTKLCYSKLRNNLLKFLLTKNQNDIEFYKVDIDLLTELKNYFTKRGLNGTTIKNYFIILKTILSTATEDNLYHGNLTHLVRRLSIKSIKTPRLRLSIYDIKSLLNCPSSYEHYLYVNIGLLQLYGNGMRQSDVFLLRFSNFGSKYIEYQTKKNGKVLQIPYTDEIKAILGNIMNIDQSKVLTHLIENTSNELIFKDLFKDDSIDSYNINSEMSPEQFNAINYLTKRYNGILKEIRIDLNLEIPNLTSHIFRHTFVNLMLVSGLAVYDVSKSLGHSTIQITQAYIKDEFDIERQINNTNRISNILSTQE